MDSNLFVESVIDLSLKIVVWQSCISRLVLFFHLNWLSYV